MRKTVLEVTTDGETYTARFAPMDPDKLAAILAAAIRAAAERGGVDFQTVLEFLRETR